MSQDTLRFVERRIKMKSWWGLEIQWGLSAVPGGPTNAAVLIDGSAVGLRELQVRVDRPDDSVSRLRLVEGLQDVPAGPIWVSSTATPALAVALGCGLVFNTKGSCWTLYTVSGIVLDNTEHRLYGGRVQTRSLL
jgi:hypothetical protein